MNIFSPQTHVSQIIGSFVRALQSWVQKEHTRKSCDAMPDGENGKAERFHQLV